MRYEFPEYVRAVSCNIPLDRLFELTYFYGTTCPSSQQHRYIHRLLGHTRHCSYSHTSSYNSSRTYQEDRLKQDNIKLNVKTLWNISSLITVNQFWRANVLLTSVADLSGPASGTVTFTVYRITSGLVLTHTSQHTV